MNKTLCYHAATAFIKATPPAHFQLSPGAVMTSSRVMAMLNTSTSVVVSYSPGALYCVVTIGKDKKNINVSKIKVFWSVLLPSWTLVKDS